MEVQTNTEMGSDNQIPPEKAKLRTVGDFLRFHREEKDIDLKTIALRTKINFSVLQDLENNNYTKIPNKTYVRGFVRSFSKEVGADIEEAMYFLDKTYEEFDGVPVSRKKEKVEAPKPEKELACDPEETLDQKKFARYFATIKNSSAKDISMFLVFFGLLFAGAMLVTKQYKLGKREEVTLNNVPYDNKPVSGKYKFSDKPAVVAETSEPKVQKEQTKKAVEKKEPIQAADKKEAVAESKQPKKEEVKEAKKDEIEDELNQEITSPLYSLKANPSEFQNSDIVDSDIVSRLGTSGFQNVYVKAYEGDSWITYRADKRDIKSFNLKEGRGVLIQGKKILLFLGNLNATRIFYNKNLVKASSSSGVKSFIFPPEEIPKHTLPLFVFEDGGKVFEKDEYVKNDD